MGLLLVIFTLLFFPPIFMNNSLLQCGAPLCKGSFDSTRGLWCHRSHCVFYQEHRVLQSDVPHKRSWSGVSRTSKKARVELNDVGFQIHKVSEVLLTLAAIILGPSSI